MGVIVGGKKGRETNVIVPRSRVMHTARALLTEVLSGGPCHIHRREIRCMQCDLAVVGKSAY